MTGLVEIVLSDECRFFIKRVGRYLINADKFVILPGKYTLH